MPALQEATTEMLPDSTLERVAEIAQCSQRLEIVHDGDQHDDRANEGNDSTQVAAEQDYICCSSQRFFFSLSAGAASALFGCWWGRWLGLENMFAFKLVVWFCFHMNPYLTVQTHLRP